VGKSFLPFSPKSLIFFWLIFLHPQLTTHHLPFSKPIH
jgi:hypothetical protein